MKLKPLTLLLVAALAAAAIVPAAAAPLSGPCTPGGVYDPACDADQNGVIDILDIQLTSGHWNQSGAFSSGGWNLTGNAGTTPGTNYIGASDNQALQLRVNNSRALLIQPNVTGSHNLVGGYNGNSVTAGAYGGVIAGGGIIGYLNTVTDHFGAVGGGSANRAGNDDGDPSNGEYATVAGGNGNVAWGEESAIGGGAGNQTAGNGAAVGGGAWNSASASYAAIGGGYHNSATSYAATVAGGNYGSAAADYASIGGGSSNAVSGQYGAVSGGNMNTAGGWYATVPGGALSTANGNYSFAAGRRAFAGHDGAFVWADSQDADFPSTATNTFRVRAQNGMVFVANNSSLGGLVNNEGIGDGLRMYTYASQGNAWAAAYIRSFGSSPGLYAASAGTYAGYFANQISVNGGCTGCTLMYVAMNAGETALKAGDLVAAAGVDKALVGAVDPVVRVRQSGPDAQGVVGVVFSRAAVTTTDKEGEVLDSLQATEGAVQPGDHLLIVVQGLAQVKVATDKALAPGQRLKASDATGEARGLRTVQVDGVTLDEGGPVVGVLLDLPDAASGLAPVMVTLR